LELNNLLYVWSIVVAWKQTNVRLLLKYTTVKPEVSAVTCLLNHCLECDKWVATNYSTLDSGLTHLFHCRASCGRWSIVEVTVFEYAILVYFRCFYCILLLHFTVYNVCCCLMA